MARRSLISDREGRIITDVAATNLKPMHRNPFRPGYGRMPPHIAGRNTEQREISSCIAELAAGAEPQSVLMIGPRGCGKTVLLNWCRRQAQEHVENVRVEMFSRDLPSDRGEMALELLESVFDAKSPDEVSAKVGAVIGGGESKWNLPKTVSRITKALIKECHKQPLLVTLDEAAACSPDGLGNFLDLTQTLNSETGKVLVVVAGTPGTMDVLSGSKASFYDRSVGLNIGLLDEDASRDAIVKPLAALGMSIERRALDKVIERSHRYPYFLQEWGKVLFDGACQRGRETITPAEVNDGMEKLNGIRGKIYESRYRDWQEGDIELLGDVLNRTRKERRSARFTRIVLRKAVEAVLQEHEGSSERTDSFTSQVLHTGFLWKPIGSVNLIPGLPSFVNHVLKQCGYRPDPE